MSYTLSGNIPGLIKFIRIKLIAFENIYFSYVISLMQYGFKSISNVHLIYFVNMKN